MSSNEYMKTNDDILYSEETTWQMFCLLIRLQNLPPGYPLRTSAIYQEIVALTKQAGYR